MIRARLPLALLATGVLALSLAGCTAAEPAPTASPTSSSEPAPALTEVTDAPGTGENLVGALADAEVARCEQSGDAWAVEGTVTNPTDAAADYRVYVSLLNAASETRALVQVDVDAVAAGATSDWSIDIAVPDADLSCVLRVERYAA